jgi:hypothetical protein
MRHVTSWEPWFRGMVLVVFRRLLPGPPTEDELPPLADRLAAALAEAGFRRAKCYDDGPAERA